MEEEYLDAKQVSYLLGYKLVRNVQALVSEGKLKATEWGSYNKFLIKKTDLIQFAHNKISKYANYYKFKSAEDKAQYWDESGFVGFRLVDESKYISVPQMAFLLGVKRQAVHGRCLKHVEHETHVINGKNRTVIRIDKFIDYAEEKVNVYSRLIDYLNHEDSAAYWEGLENGKIQ